ncbi:hypothetical protein BV20DRAFT_1025933 [Pilatotrama ljubarskyi]|nr:hypothetical protein BV20DRAFT_1025933 [Pilatotrama ljubarskyi]
MNTTVHITVDRRALNHLSAVGSGIGQSIRNASNPMASQQQAGKWSSGKPVPIQTPARMAAQISNGRKAVSVSNPFSGRLSDNLSRGSRTNSSLDSPAGNSSAQRAMAGGGRSNANGFVVHPDRPAKRQKTDTSKYFGSGGE